LQSENKRTGASVLGKFRILVNVQQWGIIIVLIILVLVLGVSSPVFLSGRNIRNILQQVSTLGILSMGMTILMISGGIDLSVGSSISVVAVIVGKLLKAGVPVGIPIVLGLLIGCFIGLINGLLASQTRAHPFILTLGTMTLFQGVAIIITEGYPITDLGDKFEWIGGGDGRQGIVHRHSLLHRHDRLFFHPQVYKVG
jgi:ribose transport system permease protein